MAIFRLLFGSSHAHGIGCSALAVSSPVKTADDAGAAFARLVSIARDARVPVRAAQNGGVHHAGQREVLGVARGAGEQARIFAPLDPGTEDSRGAFAVLMTAPPVAAC